MNGGGQTQQLVLVTSADSGRQVSLRRIVMPSIEKIAGGKSEACYAFTKENFRSAEPALRLSRNGVEPIYFGDVDRDGKNEVVFVDRTNLLKSRLARPTVN